MVNGKLYNDCNVNPFFKLFQLNAKIFIFYIKKVNTDKIFEL